MRTILFIGGLLLVVSSMLQGQDISWAKKIGGRGDITPFKSITDNSGSIYIIGYFTDSISGGTINFESVKSGATYTQDGFIAKFLSDGTLSWLKKIGGDGSDDIKGLALSNNQDTIYIVGTFQNTCTFAGGSTLTAYGNSNQDDAFLAKLKPSDGTLFNVYHFAKGVGAQLASAQRANDIKVTKDDKLLIVGQFINNVSFLNETITFSGTSNNNLFIAKVNTTGTLIWRKLLASTNTLSSISNCDLYENGIYASGYFSDSLKTQIGNYKSNSAAKQDGFLYKSDLNGNGIFIRKLVGSGSDFIISVSCDSIGQFYATGYFNSPSLTVDKDNSTTQTFSNKGTNTYDFFYTKYSSNGTLSWFNTAGSPNDDNLYRTSSGSGFLVATGDIAGDLTIDGNTITRAGGKDAMCLVQNHTDDLLYSFNLGGTGDETGRSAVIDKSGNYIFIGDFTSTKLGIFKDTLNNTGPSGKKDLFIAKFKKGSLEKISTNISCHGSNDGSIIVNPKGPLTPPYTYAWKKDNVSFGDNSSQLSNLSAGTYTVYFHDAAMPAFEIFDTIKITDPAALNLSATLGHVKCLGQNTGSINITVTGGTQRTGSIKYYYTWSSPNGSGLNGSAEDQTTLSGGTYSVNVVDSTGCSITSPAYIINAPTGSILSVTATGTTSSGSDGTATAFATGGSGNYTYLWTPGNLNTNPINGLTPNTYTVTIKDDSLCSATASVTVSLLALSVTKTNTTCFEKTDGTATVSVIGGSGDYSYTWNNGMTGASISGLAAGNYSVTVTDNNDVAKTASISVTISKPSQLTATLTPTHVKCPGASTGKVDLTISGGTMPFSHVWSNGDTTEDISNLKGNTYTLVTFNDKNNCSVTYTPVSASVTVLDTSTLGANIDTLNKTCYGSQGKNNGYANCIITGGKSPYTYRWSNGKTTKSISNLSAGTYSVTIRDAYYCSYTTTPGRIAEGPEIKGTITMTHPACNSGSDGALEYKSDVNKWGNGGLTYLWNNPGTTSTDSVVSGLASGTYTISVTDKFNCNYLLSQTVSPLSKPATPGTITGISPVCQDQKGVLYTINDVTDATSYTWSLPPLNGSIASGNGTTSVFADFTANASSGNISVYATNICGNSNDRTKAITMHQPPIISTQPIDPAAVCSGAGSSTFSVALSNEANGSFTYTWEQNNNTSGWAGITDGGIISGATTKSLSLTNPSSSYSDFRYRAKVTGCGTTITSDSATLRINPIKYVSVSIKADTTAVCQGSSVVLTATGINPGTNPNYSWKVGTLDNQGDGSSTFSFIPSNGDQVSCTLTSDVICGANSPASSNLVSINVSNTSDGGSLNGITEVCQGSTTGTITLSSYLGDIKKWQYSEDGNNWIDINNTSNTYSNTLNTSTQFRVEVKNEVCDPQFSQIHHIKVDTFPEAGTILGTSNICEGTQAGTLTIQGYKGNIIKWQSSLNGSDWSDINSISDSYNPGILLQTTNYRAEIANGVCNPVYPTYVAINVDALSLGGSISSPTNAVCIGSPSDLLTLSGHRGNITKWQSSVNGALWTDINNTNTTYISDNLPQSTQFRAEVKNGTCDAVSSGSFQVTTSSSLIADVDIAANTSTFCKGKSVIFNATPINGGNTPTYKWKVNNISVSSNGASLTFTPQSTDVVICEMTSNASCVSVPKVLDTISLNTIQKIILSNLDITRASSSQAVDGKINLLVAGGISNKLYTLTPGNLSNNTGLFTVKPGSYNITVTDDSKCDTFTTPVVVDFVTALIEKQMVESKIYPNPNKGEFYLNISNKLPENANIEIYSILGTKVYKEAIITEDGKINKKLKIGNLPKGMYILKVNNKTFEEKLIIQ